MKKIFFYIKQLWYGLFWGMKDVEENILKADTSTIPGNAIIQEVNDHRVSRALLKGELTQEVKELRYRTYKVDREAKEYEYYAPTLAMKRDKNDSKFIKYENEDNLEIITIQPNDVNISGMTEEMNNYDFSSAIVIGKNEDIRLNINNINNQKRYLISVTRDFYPRFKIEEYTKRLVVRKLDETHAILDFYVSIYPNDKDIKSKPFIKEVEKIKDNKVKSNIIDFDKVHFITNHAYNQLDMLEYEFDNVRFRTIVEYDGHYILRFNSRILKNGIDLTDQYYCKSMDEKYKNKVKKEKTIDLFETSVVEKYVCEDCGKEIYYDPEYMDNMPVCKPRDIDEDVIEELDSNTEYMDIQIAQQTYGKALCKNCLKKYIENNKHNL